MLVGVTHKKLYLKLGSKHKLQNISDLNVWDQLNEGAPKGTNNTLLRFSAWREFAMSALKQLSNIDKKTKYTVFGWVRELEKELQIGHVPTMLTSICILYYKDDEIFDLIADGIELSENKKCITVSDQDGVPRCNYGIVQIPSNCDGVYRWDIKLSQLDSTYPEIRLGLSTIRESGKFWSVVHDKAHLKSLYLYSFTGYRFVQEYQGFWKSYGKIYVGNDIISIILDLEKREISFMVNAKDQGVAYQNIPKNNNLKYQLMVAIGYRKGDCAEIINFSKC